MKPSKTIKPGNVGVNVTDERTPARMFILTDHPHRMGIALFEPLDDPGALTPFPINDFWVLFDNLPQ